MSSLFDALILAQFGLLSVTQHRHVLASLQDANASSVRPPKTLKIVQGTLQAASVGHFTTFFLGALKNQDLSTFTLMARLAAALVSLQCAQLVGNQTLLVTLCALFAFPVTLVQFLQGERALGGALACEFCVLFGLAKHYIYDKRQRNGIALSDDDTRQLAEAREKDLVAEEGHAVDEKPIQYKGYAVMSTDTWKDFRLINFTPKKVADYDVEIAIQYCGVCASDVHTITGGWRPNIVLPMITGHEIVGHVKSVGPKVTKFKPGDRVGVGAQSDSCRDCDRCDNNNEQYCFNSTSTYNSHHLTGEISHGGYSTGKVANELFVFPIPDEMPLKQAASMCCGGLTVFSPLKRYGAGPGKKVAVIGIGGLGHYALQFAAALGADDVIAISHTESKKEDAFKMGATRFVATANDGLQKSGLKNVDIIISTIDVNTAIPIKDLCAIMSIGGALVSVGLPDGKVPLGLGDLSVSAANLTCTNIGSKAEAIEMFDLAVKKGVRTWIQEYDMKDCSTAVQALHGDLPGTEVRYRQVLKMDIDY